MFLKNILSADSGPKDGPKASVVVIGAGIAGLTTAFRLKEAGINVTILEQSSSAGGCIRTISQNGYLLELGPNTFLNSSERLWKLARAVGLEGDRIETPQKISRRRFVFKKDSLIKVTGGPGILFSPLLSIRARARLLGEPFIKPLRDGVDESLAGFVRRRLGGEVLDNLVTPFVSGIYAGDPERLSLASVFPRLSTVEKKYGSILRGMKELKSDLKSSGLGSFKGGIGMLSAALESALKDELKKDTRVIGIDRVNDIFRVKTEKSGEASDLLAGAVILATPAYSASGLIEPLSDSAGHALAGIEYAPILVIHTGFKSSDVPYQLDGFGFLVPRRNRVRQLGCLWSSSLFAGRAPSENVLLTSFMGGMLDKEAMDLSNDDIMRTVLKDLSKTLSIKSRPQFACITRYTHAIPQYHIGHQKRIADVASALEKIRGLFLTGSYFRGISVADTIEHAEGAAENAVNYLRQLS